MTLEKQEERKLKAMSLTYPSKPDGKGSARVNFCGKAYYFGNHNTIDSFSLFGEWRRQMIEKGEATEPKILRVDLANRKQESVAALEEGIGTTRLRLIVGTACFVILCVAIFGAAKFSSTAGLPAVDGQALTEDEIRIIQRIRTHTANRNEHARKVQPSAAELTLQLVKEGPRNGKHHQNVFKPPGS